MSKIKIQDALECDIYYIHIVNGVKYIHIDGYFYLNEDGGELNQYAFAMMPLERFVNNFNDEESDFDVDEFLSEQKCYVTDYLPYDEDHEEPDLNRVIAQMQIELDTYFDHKGGYCCIEPLAYEDLTADTPCGYYINL